MTNIYIGNLSYETSESHLEELFNSHHSDVSSVKIIKDRDTGRSKGFGFVEIDDDEQAKSVIDKLNGQEFMGRNLVVNEARPRTDRRGGGGGGKKYNNRYNN